MVQTSLFTGLSGLRTHQTYIDVIGNNLANVSTPGFWGGSRATFSDILSFTVRAGLRSERQFRRPATRCRSALGAFTGRIGRHSTRNQGTLQDTGRRARRGAAGCAASSRFPTATADNSTRASARSASTPTATLVDLAHRSARGQLAAAPTSDVPTSPTPCRHSRRRSRRPSRATCRPRSAVRSRRSSSPRTCRSTRAPPPTMSAITASGAARASVRPYSAFVGQSTCWCRPTAARKQTINAAANSAPFANAAAPSTASRHRRAGSTATVSGINATGDNAGTGTLSDRRRIQPRLEAATIKFDRPRRLEPGC